MPKPHQTTKGMAHGAARTDQGRKRCVGMWTGASCRTGRATLRGWRSDPGNMKGVRCVAKLARTGISQRRQSIHISMNHSMVGCLAVIRRRRFHGATTAKVFRIVVVWVSAQPPGVYASYSAGVNGSRRGIDLTAGARRALICELNQALGIRRW